MLLRPMKALFFKLPSSSKLIYSSLLYTIISSSSSFTNIFIPSFCSSYSAWDLRKIWNSYNYFFESIRILRFLLFPTADSLLLEFLLLNKKLLSLENMSLLVNDRLFVLSFSSSSASSFIISKDSFYSCLCLLVFICTMGEPSSLFWESTNSKNKLLSFSSSKS